MLVLSRKCGEKIMVGDDIVLTVTEILGGRVRIGIEAPKDVRILRRELWSKRNGNASSVPAVSGEQGETGADATEAG